MSPHSALFLVLLGCLPAWSDAPSPVDAGTRSIATEATSGNTESGAARSSATDAWVEAMVDLAESGGPFKEEVDCFASCCGEVPAIDYDAMADYGQSLAGCYCYYSTDILQKKDILLFIEAGYSALPELMRHIRDDRLTGWTFNHSLYSSVDPDQEPQMVGTIACYLIEAILRKNPHFTRSYSFSYDAPPGSDDVEAARYALHQAAAAYERWYQECFDESTCTSTCPPDRLPDVKWHYDLKWWEWYRNSDVKRGSDAWRDIVGKTVLSSKTGRRGYMLLLSDGAWLSCFLSDEHRKGIDWHYGMKPPGKEELALLGHSNTANTSCDLSKILPAAHGKKLGGLQLGDVMEPIFQDGLRLQPWIGYDREDQVTALSVEWIQGHVPPSPR